MITHFFKEKQKGGRGAEVAIQKQIEKRGAPNCANRRPKIKNGSEQTCAVASSFVRY